MDTAPAPGLLYLSYTGMLEPLGQSQVLAYLERLAADRPVHLVSFERAEDAADPARVDALRARIGAAGIHWHPLRYHRRFSVLATLYDVAAGILVGARLARRHALGIVHARSYVPGAMALAIKRLSGARFVFDMRGFWADERVDGGLWPAGGVLHRVAKRLEKRLLLAADHVVSLTHAGVRELRRFPYLADTMPPTTVIPTCADLDRFRPGAAPAERGPPTVGYVGSAGTWYLFDAAVSTFRILLSERPDARLLIVNRDAHAYIRERLAAGGVPESAFELRAAGHAEVPALMARMDAGVFFIKPVFSKQASAPTKLGEFLGCGVPCLSNSGVGDMAQVLREDDAGVAVDAFDDAALRDGVRRLLALVDDPDTRARCVATAHRHFSLAEGVERYRRVYAAVSSGAAPDRSAARDPDAVDR